MENDIIPFIINLDPAVEFTNYHPDLDIRDHMSYQEIMVQYKLGPNGAILTCLNLLCTQINILLDKINSEVKNNKKIFIIDTPG